MSTERRRLRASRASPSVGANDASIAARTEHIRALSKRVKLFGERVNAMAHQANLGMVPIRRSEVVQMLNEFQLVTSEAIAVLDGVERLGISKVKC